MAKISIIGTGYVGLITGTCLANLGHRVTCVDIDKEKVGKINRGGAPIYEPGLGDLLKRAVTKGMLRASSDLGSAVRSTDITIIAVGTPAKKDGSIDLTYVKNVAAEVGGVLRGKENYHVVTVKSTVVPSTTDTIIKPILEKSSGKKVGQFGLCMNPEFLREGNAVKDFMHPDRIVVGSSDTKAFNVYKNVYKKFSCPVLCTNLRTAEMIKYTSNSLFATLISYANDIAGICEAVGDVDVEKVMEGVHLDHRLTPTLEEGNHHISKRLRPGMLSFLKAGCGYGGSCFPKDTKALFSHAKNLGHHSQILEGVIGINEGQPLRLMKRLEKEMKSLRNKKIAVWGLSFKPDTDDVRETPAKPVIGYLLKKGARISAYDPIAVKQAQSAFSPHPALHYAKNHTEAATGAHAVVVLTSWDQFRKVDFHRLAKSVQKNAVVVDGRRMYDRREVLRAGLRYIGVGYR